MTFKVFKETEAVKPDVFLDLVPTGSCGIKLVAKKADGTAYPSGNILTISRGGELSLHSGVNKTIGLQLYPDSTIKLSDSSATNLRRRL